MVSARPPRPAILKYYLYQAADSVGFIWPVFTLFLLWNDLSFTQIGALSAISAILVVAFEIPTGYVADRYGRRNALVVGMAAMVVSTIGFVVADTFVEFAVLYAIWALAMAFQHGTADAWLYETLRAEMDEESFTRVRGRGGAVYQWTSAVTMIAGGFLYVVHPTYPFVASALLNAVGVAVVLTMPRNVQFEASAVDDAVGVRASLAIVRTQFTAPGLRTVVPYVALFFGVVHVADTYIQPITVEVLDGRLVDAMAALPIVGVAVPEEAVLGFVYAGFAVVAAIASYHAETVRRWVGLRHALLVIPVLTAASFLLPPAVPLLAIPVFFAMKGAYELCQPLVNQYLNDRTAGTGRATVLSAASMAYAIVRAPLMPMVGIVADGTTPIMAVAVLGSGFLVVAVITLSVGSPMTAPATSRRVER